MVSHLLFANDSLLFCKTDDKDKASLVRALTAYKRATGQKINYGKSSIYLPQNISGEQKDALV